MKQHASSIFLTNRKNNSVHWIDCGKRISYQKKNDNKIYRGILQAIKDNFLEVNDEQVSLNDLKNIHYSPLTLSAMRILGIIFLFIGILIFIYGFLMMMEAKKSEAFVRPILTMVGAMFIVIGTASDFLGVLPFVIHTRIYDLENKWTAACK